MTFIQYVAKNIFNKYGNNMSRIAVVFPNKRASLFINEELAKLTTHPILTPKYYTISELFEEHSTLPIGDDIKLVSMLHKTYTRIIGEKETLDRFYGWGELMINDFDDIDKHLADADHIFTNVSNIKELTDLSYLEDEQKNALRTFFPQFDNEQTKLKEKFLHLWSKLSHIYHEFNNDIRKENILYVGAAYKECCKRLNKGETFEYDDYIFVGFNHLLPVEEKLFLHLQSQGKAHFYWDYDNAYLNGGNEAGTDIKHNLHIFGNEAKEELLFDNLSKEKERIDFVSCKTNNIQATFVSQWLTEEKIKAGHKTAIVLADERLLPAVIHSLPTEANKVNITIGYALAYTDAPVILQRLQQEKNYKNADSLNDKIAYLATSIAKILNEEKDVLKIESLFRTYNILNRLKKLSEEGWLEITSVTFEKLLTHLLAKTSVPFHGEPIEGVQVMGVLETRNLDFDHILMLSCNEKLLPKTGVAISFIPHFIRKAFKLTTQDSSVGTYAYYFFRMLQRCKDATLMWNSSTEGTNCGEMSRFMLQMLTTRNDITKHALFGQQNIATILPTYITKSASMNLDKMTFSATSLGKYLKCQKMFYYNYVLRLKEYEDPEKVGQDGRFFGNIFHKAVEKLYTPLIGKQINRNTFEELNDLGHITRIVDETYQEELTEYGCENMAQVALGLKQIHIHIISKLVAQLIKVDSAIAPITIISLEKSYYDPDLGMNGKIDRLDFVSINGEPRLRIVDYKTGGSKFTPDISTINDIFSPETQGKYPDYYLQTLLYSAIINQQKENILKNAHINCDTTKVKVTPVLFFIQHSYNEEYDPTLSFKNEKIDNIAPYEQQIRENVKMLKREICNTDLPFTSQPQQNRTCEHCPYSRLCWK